jgi:hypothetical protein
MFKFQNPKQKTFQRKSLSVAGPERVRDQWESVLDDEQDQEASVKRRRPLHLSTLREWIRHVHNEQEARNNAEDCPTAA